MSISPTSTPPLPTSTPRLDTQAAVQAQSRAQAPVPPTAVTNTGRQNASGGFSNSGGDRPRGAPTGGRGRIIDITA
jgi:hypothetical protein